MDQYWLPHEDSEWIPGVKIGTEGDKVTFQTADGGKVIVPKSKADSLDVVQSAQLEGVDNMCKLDNVNAGALLHTVRTRYGKKQIYTRVARILIALNPFEPLNIYSSEYLDKFMKGVDSLDMEPHVYGIGLDAVMGLRQGKEFGDGRNQAVLISGESGAGKTESTKLVLSYVAEAIGGRGSIQEQILQTNPILESFGNAMTVRNNNSSRFGKWLEMSISPAMTITGCTITDYLLELTRVITQGEKERNYHIFFQVVQARGRSEMASLGTLPVEEYAYLNGGQKTAPGIKDDDCFEELKDAFNSLSFTEECQLDIFKVVVGILFLGNCEFKEAGEVASLTSDAPAKKAAELLGFSLNELIVAMTVKKLVVGKDIAETPLSKAGASAARDGLSRLLYGRLFKWLIKRVNLILHHGAKGGEFFGVLDIAGFESFEHNSLEQLFINLSNEHLQQHFNNHIFKMELEDYAKEGITAGEGLSYQDNADVVTLIGATGTGILSILDDEAIFSKATDQTFAAKVFKAHEKNPRLHVPKFAGAVNFGLRHFAGEVTYSCEGWLEKNIDKPPEDAPGMLKSSKNSVLEEVGAEMAAEQAEAASEAVGRRGSAMSKKKPKTLGSGFRTSLAALVDKLNEAEPHFIRCVKPNAEKVPSRFTARLVMEQLTFSGIMEAVRIRQQGYASRVPFEEFCGKYRCILPRASQKKIFADAGLTGAALATAVLEALPPAVGVGALNPKDFVVGKTKVLGKVTGISLLDKSRDLALSGYAVDIQRIHRGAAVRLQMRQARAVFSSMTAWIKKNNFYELPGSDHTALAMLKSSDAIDEEVAALDKIFTAAESLPMTLPSLDKVKKVKQRMQSESALSKQFRDIEKSIDPVEIGKALARAKDLDIDECSEAKALIARNVKLKIQIPLVKAMQDALDSDDSEKLNECMGAMNDEGLRTQPENWVVELKGEELAARVHDATRAIAEKKVEMEAKLKAEQDEHMQKEQENSTQEALEPMTKKKSERTTITGMSETDQTALLLSLAAACHEYDVEALESRLGEATKQGIDAEKLEPSVTMMNKLQSEDFLVDTIKEMQEDVLSDCPGAHALKCLQNLVAQAKRLNVASDLVDECQPTLQKSVRRRARYSTKGSIFDSIDIAELNIGEEAFNSLANFPNLKTPSQWKGHRTGTLFHRAQGKDSGDSKVMLTHSKQEMKAALTKVASTQETPAIQQFRNLLGWMSDRPVPECHRIGYSQDIILAAKSDPGLGDEIYVQVMKQLTENPSRRSSLLGWKLLLMLCQQVCPSEALEEFVRSFLMSSLKRNQELGLDEAVTIAKQCISDLNTSVRPRRDLSTENGAEETIIPVQVYLIDNSTRKVFIGASQTLKILGERVAEKLKISNFKDFSFYQMTDGLDTHRLLPEQTVLATLSEKWSTLKEVTQRTSRLLWKRRFLRVDETLQAGDLIHATLTYRQALWDYHHYPIPEDCRFMVELGATLLYLEQDHYMDYIKSGKLGEVGVLEQLLPEVVLRHQKRAKWAQQVLDAYSNLQKHLNSRETRLQQMSRMMSGLQRMKLFGTYFWLGRQTYQIPKEKLGLPESKMPAQMCKINPKEPEAEYWICVDLYGIRFLAVDAAPGTEFQRGFLFNEEALERMVLWGAKQNIVQFVVQTVNPAFPAAGRIPMTIALISPAAVDVAYVVHHIANDRKRQKI